MAHVMKKPPLNTFFFFSGHIVAPRTRSTFTDFGQAETAYGTQMDTFSHLLKRGLQAKRLDAEAADGPLESSRKDEAFFPAVKTQPLLVEDPLVINSPQLFLPKKHKAVFKQIPAALEKRPKSKQVPQFVPVLCSACHLKCICSSSINDVTQLCASPNVFSLCSAGKWI